MLVAAVAREPFAGGTRVPLIPASVAGLAKAGVEVIIERSAGEAAGVPDPQYADAGAKAVPSREGLFAADVILQVRAAGSNPEAGRADLDRFRPGQVVIGMCEPLGA